jgi:hypothetical protein
MRAHDQNQHTKCVTEWLGQAAISLSTEQLVDLFEQAMIALWNRAHVTLGTVTLAAILDRVLYTATEKFPLFESLKIGNAGVDFGGLGEREPATAMSNSQLAEGIIYVLVEFLSVVGNLTAEILTPALHAELSKVRLNDSAPGTKGGGKGKS